MPDVTGPAVTLDGTPVEGALVAVIHNDTGEVLNWTTTDINGNWTTAVAGGQTVQARIKYRDANGNLYQEYNKPYVVVEGGGLVIEDHEAGGAITDYYVGSTSSFSIANDTTLQGNFLVSVAASGVLGYTMTPVCSRGNRYTTRIFSTAASNYRPLAFVQDAADPLANCYALRVDTGGGYIQLQEWSAGVLTTSPRASVTFSLNTEYHASIEAGPTGTVDNVVGRVYDATGTELAATSLSSDLHDGGTYGFYTDAASGSFDYTTEEPI